MAKAALRRCYPETVRLLAVLVLATACGRIAFDPVDRGDGGDVANDNAVGVYNRAFVTSQTYGVPWGGVTQASLYCREAAAAAGLDGSYLALLGDAATGPVERPPFPSARGWVDLAGAVVVDTPAEWIDGRMRRPLHLDEFGVSIGYERLWLGARASATCENWNTPTAPSPSVAYTTNPFDAFTVMADCTAMNHFICVEFMRNTPVVEAPQTGRLAFVTTATWTPGLGINGADALCATEATSHSFAGSFKALLTTSTATGLSRFSLTGAPWVRVDGIRFVDSAMDLADRPVLAAFLLRADGSPPLTGAGNWAWMGSAPDNCTDWSSNANGVLGITGDSTSAERAQFFSRQSSTCNSARPLVCLQQ
jgi:hypothetical protein